MLKKLCLLLFVLCHPIFFDTRISATEVKDLDLSISLSEAQRQKISFEAPDDSKKKQYSIFLMDSSRSMGGRSVKQTKDIVGKFVKESGASKQAHQVALVSFGDEATVLQAFTPDEKQLLSALEKIETRGKTNLHSGLKQAEQLLQAVKDEGQKNIFIISDRTPTTGEKLNTGKYGNKDIYSYQFANAADNLAQKMKTEQQVSFRTFVFIDKIADSTKAFARTFFQNIQTDGAFDFRDVQDMDFVFKSKEAGKEFQSGTFNYGSAPAGKEGRDSQAVYHYSDSYFEQSAYAYRQEKNRPYDPRLATMSLNLELAAWSSIQEKNYLLKIRNAKNLLEEIGFEKFKANQHFQERPSTDSIGAVIAQKKLTVKEEDYTLIALAIRGGGYEAEWASNLTLGRSGEHQGFREASEKALTFLDQYLKEHKVTGKVKLWINGYSRAAAVTNLTAGALNKGRKLASGELKAEDMYAFCFEAPAGTLKGTGIREGRHDNIVNVINVNDVVTKVGPEVYPFEFTRYGQDSSLPDKTLLPQEVYETAKSRMEAELKKLDSNLIYKLEEFQAKKISILDIFNGLIVDDPKGKRMNESLDDIIRFFAVERIKNRNKYVNAHQEDIRILAELYFTTRVEDREKLTKSLFKNLVTSMMLGSDATKVKKIVVDWLRTMGLVNHSEVRIESLAETFRELVFKFMIKHPNLSVTLVSNLDPVAQAHHPDLCLAWLRAQDENYQKEKIETPEPSKTSKRILIAGDVDIKVKRETGEMEEYSTDEVMELSTSAAEDTTVLVQASEATKVDYTVQTIDNMDGSVFLTEEFEDVELNAGEKVEINLYKESENKATELIKEGEQLSSETRGKEESSKYYATNVRVENENLGFVLGGGMTRFANYSPLYSIPRENAEFVGWYKGDELLSSENTYQHQVKAEEELVAKFREVKSDDQ
ncbi:vWA domain-containing protein [Lactococcus petauri]|uniref:VWA domain-containing protein n=3 Tax=Streptococcaceae TaxID=1300 RepID=A0ABZ2SH68_9LACT|nr:VWA domain-containing protein [Lactococcus petauri]MCV5953608.1 VWA domain-containing protein [Lactococcus petauri]MCV5967664.1 VWA domain-containing protein [Lactococcus petauri]MCV5970384.1 VWA domain-containing protein [Lactococcus petauri]MCV5981342.1 VWA domain-containing protein [Lactococcus petauri]